MNMKIVLWSAMMCCLSSTLLADNLTNVPLLASSCAACHGTNGHSAGGIPTLAGLDKLHIAEQMRQFVSKQRSSTVMAHHASGYSLDEIELMAAFFAKQ